jgi:hypothetical protein
MSIANERDATKVVADELTRRDSSFCEQWDGIPGTSFQTLWEMSALEATKHSMR